MWVAGKRPALPKRELKLTVADVGHGLVVGLGLDVIQAHAAAAGDHRYRHRAEAQRLALDQAVGIATGLTTQTLPSPSAL